LHLKKKNNGLTLFVSIFFLILISLTNFNFNSFKSQIHSASEWIISGNNGFSSFFNIIDDGSIEYRGNYAQPISNKLTNLFLNIPSITKNRLVNNIDNQVSTIYLDIKFKDYEKILEDRKSAIKDKHAILIDFQEVKADLIIDGIPKKAKISLKGLLETHWMVKRRMSLKIKVLQDDTVLGFKEFSLQKPRERQWPYNFVFENISNKFNLLSTNSTLLNVVVNGEEWGVMLAEESIGKTYLENQQKLSSLIFKFGDAREWFEGWSDDSLEIYRRSDPSFIFKVYNQQKFLENDPELIFRNKISYVLNLREQHDVNLFNQKQMAESFMLSALWGNFHNLLNNNTAYYFNPYTLKLEPILRDQYGFEPISSKEKIQQWPPPYQFLMALENYNKNYLSDFADNLKDEMPYIDTKFLDAKQFFPVDKLKKTNILLNNLNNFYAQKESFINFDPNKYYKKLNNGALLDRYQIDSLERFKNKNYTISQNQSSRFTDLIYARHFTNGQLKIYNLIPDDVTIESIEFNGLQIINNPIKIENYLTSEQPLIIKTDILGVQDNKIKIHAAYKNIQHKSYNDLSLIQEVENPFKFSDVPSFFKKIDKEWVVASGSWQINQNIFIKGDVRINEGVRLNFAEDASLIIEGNLNAIGSTDSSITFSSLAESWNGLYVFNSSKGSVLKNVIFQNTTGIANGILDLTGGVVFYNAKVDMEDIIFSNTVAEDALNIVNSTYYLKNLSFYGSRSDAFDSDYSLGVINSISFNNIGGDALDFSGSNVKINGFFAENVRDKAISVGENSIVDITNVKINNVGVAIASKDGSSAYASNCKIENFKLSAFMTYVKKNNYSSPSLSLKNCLTANQIFEEVYFRQKGTELISDNEENIVEQDLDVDLLYQSEVMKK